MWTFDPAQPESQAAIAFLKSYGAPEPTLVHHPKPIIDILSVVPAAVDNLLLNELYELQEKYTEDAVAAYANATANWLLNVAQQPGLPVPAIPELPSLIPPMVQLLFQFCPLDAPLVVSCPPLALRLLRQANVVAGDPNEYTPYPRVDTRPVDNRVIGDESASAPGYFLPGPADHFPDHFVYTQDGKSYLKLASPFGAVWVLLKNGN
ncbi:MAG TPA: hypothetical protein VJN43_21830 [Bryobacteraceae bacterium]|nr:hypothetical protein [Bryobacteraceae bacterium]